MKVYLEEGAKMPTRAHETDAGLDLYSRESIWINAGSRYPFDTGVHVELPPDTAGLVLSKSGLNVKHDLTCEGVIDVGYTGSIVVKLYNNGNMDYSVKKGDKIGQLVIVPILKPKLEPVNSLEEFVQSERGAGGFGSSGR